MELDANLIALQGILRDLMKTTGDFSKIKYKGGNEKKVAHITEAMRQYLLKTFPNKDGAEYIKQMQNMTLFLIINTKFEDNGLLNVKEYMHLINVIPILSKCLLANLLVELKLSMYYCSIMSAIPLHINEEMLNEMISCLRQCEPHQALEDTYIILTAIIKLLGTLDLQQNEEIVEKFGDISSEMLKNIAGINPDLIQNWKKLQIHKHMGHTLLYLLKLLKSCPLYDQRLSRIMDDIIRVTMTIMQAVTINVFCAWAEVKLNNDQPMQTVVAGEAYLVIEHLQKYKPGKELLQMLGTIAKKPKTINEIILEADVATVIANINKCDDNQKLWFKAFLNTNVLQNEDALTCLDKWAHLCSQDDVTRLLNLSVSRKEPRIKKLVMKCARSLNIEALKWVTTRYFRECNNTDNLNTESVKEELTVVLNKTQNNSEADDNFIKDIYLLLLQNPNLVLSTLYTECLKKSVHTQRLKNSFKSIKSAVEIHGILKTVFIKLFSSRPPAPENVLLYKDLVNVLLELEYFQDHVLVREVFTPQLQEFVDRNEYESLLYTLQILNLITIKPVLNQDDIPTIMLLANILERTRYQFFSFSYINQQIVQETINLILKYSTQNSSYVQFKDCLEQLEMEYRINKFYISNLFPETKVSLLQFVYPNLNVNNHPETVSQLTKLLSSCVTSEWILTARELESQHGYKKTLKLYHGILLLLCHITNTQIQPENNESVITALTFCLHQYEIVVKEVLQPKYSSSVEDENLLTKHICCLLKDIPKGIRKEEGLRLTGLLSNQSLQSLKKDREFLLSLIAIQDTTISQLLAQKMLS